MPAWQVFIHPPADPAALRGLPLRPLHGAAPRGWAGRAGAPSSAHEARVPVGHTGLHVAQAGLLNGGLLASADGQLAEPKIICSFIHNQILFRFTLYARHYSQLLIQLLTKHITGRSPWSTLSWEEAEKRVNRGSKTCWGDQATVREGRGRGRGGREGRRGPQSRPLRGGPAWSRSPQWEDLACLRRKRELS